MYQNPYLPFSQQQFQQQPVQQPFQQFGQQQAVHGFVYVNGIEGAKAYQLPPNSEMPLFDSNADDVMYVKKTDGAGYPTITVVDCTERGSAPASSEYVTREELDRIYGDLGRQINQIREAMYGAVPQTTAAAEPAAADDARQPARHVSAAS